LPRRNDARVRVEFGRFQPPSMRRPSSVRPCAATKASAPAGPRAAPPPWKPGCVEPPL